MNLPFQVDGVNIFGVANSGPASRPRYHHGDLRNALLETAVSMARAGGPDAIVLREVARRVGVSANAAYRHFGSVHDLVQAVGEQGLAELADAMSVELAQVPSTDDPPGDAVRRLEAVGRGYIHFALTQPGLFGTAFSLGKAIAASGVQDEPSPLPADTATPDELSPDTAPRVAAPRETAAPDAPWELLQHALDDLLEHGLLSPADREAAATQAWAAVHGLSLLLLGPMADLGRADKDNVIAATLDLVLRGLLARPATPS